MKHTKAARRASFRSHCEGHATRRARRAMRQEFRRMGVETHRIYGAGDYLIGMGVAGVRTVTKARALQ